MEILSDTNLLKDSLNGIPMKNISDEHFQVNFTTQPAPTNQPERNDQYWPKIYDFKKHGFEIAIKPLNTPFWRFGFRYSKTNDFPPNTEARHRDKNIVDIHICVGDMRKNRKWHNENKVYLQSYHVPHRLNPQLIEEKYKGEEIILITKWNAKNSQVHYELKSDSKIMYQNEFNLGGFNSCIFGGWADFNDYTLATDIKVI
jgi:hypothetical protein